MKNLLKILVCAVAGLMGAGMARASAADIYITPTGAASGVCTGTVHDPAWFNSGANWGAGGTQIGPATTVHLCGTFSGSANGTVFTFQGSGTSGNNITLLWETGAIVQAPYCSFNGCINMDNRSFIVLDGGVNGLLQNTANGTSLANHIDATVGISGGSCNTCEIKNLTIANMYVHVAPGDDTLTHQTINAISFSGSHWKIHDFVIHDCGWCILNFWHAGDTDVEIGPNFEIYNMDHGGTTAGTSGNATLFRVHDGHIHDMANWDTTSGNYHHDGWHGFQAGSGQMTGMKFYNLLFDGNPGANLTSQGIYFERQDSAVASTGLQIFNNVIDGHLTTKGSFGMIGIGDLVNTLIANNTLIGVNINNPTPAPCFLLNGGSTTLKNNVCIGSWTGTWFYGVSPSSVWNYNTYANMGACGIAYTPDTVCHTTLANWQSTSGGQDANSQLIASAGLDGTYHPTTIALPGENLTSLGIADLNKDKGGVARLSSGNWIDGAFTTAGAVQQQGPPPVLLSVILQ